MLRGHVYATEAEAVLACEVLDAAYAAAHTPTEELRTVLGSPSLRRALAAGYVTAEGSITPAGEAVGLVLDGTRIVRVQVVPRRPWGARPVALTDGTYLVMWDARLDSVEARAVVVRGQPAVVPRARDAVTRSRSARVDPEFGREPQ